MKYKRFLDAIKKQQNSLFVKYIAFLLAMLIIPLALGVTVLSLSMGGMRAQARENSYKKLQQIQKGFDSEMEQIRTAAVQLATDKDILAYEYDVNNRQSIYDLIAIMQQLRNFLPNGQSLVLDAYIYYSEEELYISKDSRYLNEEVYNLSFQYQDMDYNTWSNLAGERYYDAMIPQSEVAFQDSKGTRQVITYLQSFPVNNAKVKGNIIIMLDAGVLAELFSEYQQQGNGGAIVNHKQNQVIFYTGAANYPQEELLTLEEGYFEQKIGQEKGFVSVCQGDNGYQYISIESAKTVYAAAQRAKYVIIGYIMIILLLGLGLLVVVIYRGILPVRKLLVSIGMNFGTSNMEAVGGNELEYLEACFSRMMNEKQSVESIVRQQKPVMQKTLLIDLLNDNIADENFAATCKAAGLEFLHESYVVAVFQLSVKQREEDFQNAALVKYAISNIAEELFSAHAQAFSLDTGWRSCAILVNFDPSYMDRQGIETHCSFLKQVIDEQLDENVQIAIGKAYTDVKKVSLSYAEAKQAEAYQVLMGDSSVVQYADMENSSHNYRYHYSLEQENALMNAVMMGDAGRAQESLDRIMKLNQSLSFDVMRLLFFDLMCTTLRVLNQQEFDLSLLFDGKDPYSSVIECESFAELNETIRTVLCNVCDYVAQNRSDKKETLKTELLRYLETHLSDINLSMEAVADAFSLSYTYVSHFFKEYIGENFSSYLAKLKTEKAKEYLSESDMTVGEIASRLGYANSTVFIRNFKKIAGMTPGQFRELNQD